MRGTAIYLPLFSYLVPVNVNVNVITPLVFVLFVEIIFFGYMKSEI